MATFRPRRRPDARVALPAGATVMDLLRAVEQPLDGTLCVRGGVPVPEDEVLADGDEVLLVSSFSGG